MPWNAGLSLGGAYGRMGNASNTETRAMAINPFDLDISFKLGKFNLGLSYEYYISNQLTDPSSVGNQNLTGSGNVSALIIGFLKPEWGLLINYNFNHFYTLEQQTVSGLSIKYKGTGYKVRFIKHYKGIFGYYIEYANDSFSDSTADPIKSSRAGLGLILMNFAGK